ncbi:vomeronasal type-2 receptor 26-like [Ranitomeya imitator]|uniref:vomeronasal type-2 receptor 26-like n=1 Tax=Ranitomeya imitator TaxID=111125 RepID=UPI0037E8E153
MCIEHPELGVSMENIRTARSHHVVLMEVRREPPPYSEICHRCPDDKWPDEKKVKCVPKTYEFLSYEKDDIVIIFTFTSILLSVVTILILGIFIHYWETPIVKANNRIVSFILLVSTFLSFMSIFLFLGPPVDVTCMLRQIIFGISLSISLSSILSKTITVCIAFKATKPNSVWRRWIGLKTSKYVVVTCSSVQVLICVFWISLHPPYREYDMTLYTDRIIIQCNEGSDIWFYSMLGYLGLLAALSFVLAFMVRTLPDNFNEAKYITFSMLVFCSVWISMIPAYLSSKGKYMVYSLGMTKGSEHHYDSSRCCETFLSGFAPLRGPCRSPAMPMQ